MARALTHLFVFACTAAVLCVLTSAMLLPAEGREESVGIVAVVGEDAISSTDLDNRLRFILSTTGLSGGPEVVERLTPQVVRALIDEKLQMQEAARSGIQISPSEIEQAMGDIEKQRGMESGGIYAHLDRHHIPRETFLTQLQSQIAWSRVISRKVKPLVHLSEDEVERAQRKFSPTTAREDVQIALVTLPIDRPEQEGNVRRLAEKLVSEIEAGASFEAVGGQFSSRSGSGGQKVAAFWVQPEQLDPDIAKALAAVQPGNVTQPVRTPDGYSIVKLYERRALTKEKANDTEVLLKEILLKLKYDAAERDVDVLLSIGAEIAKNPGACTDKGVANLDNLEDFDIAVNFRREILQEMPAALRTIAESLAVGEVSQPFASAEGIRLFMLCEKTEIAPVLAEREKVYSLLFQEKLELEAQKLMRNLRRDVFIEVRL